MVVASDLFPEIVNAACGVDFLLAALGGDLLQVIAPDLRRDCPVADKAHHVFGKQVFCGVVRLAKQWQWPGSTDLPRAEERVNERPLPDAADAFAGRRVVVEE